MKQKLIELKEKQANPQVGDCNTPLNIWKIKMINVWKIQPYYRQKIYKLTTKEIIYTCKDLFKTWEVWQMWILVKMRDIRNTNKLLVGRQCDRTTLENNGHYLIKQRMCTFCQSNSTLSINYYTYALEDMLNSHTHALEGICNSFHNGIANNWGLKKPGNNSDVQR